MKDADSPPHALTYLLDREATGDDRSVAVMVPGLFARADNPLMSHTTKELRARGMATMRVELYALGTDTFMRHTIGDLAHATQSALLDAQKHFEDVVVIAHSLGAYIALQGTPPDTVSSIHLWDPSLHPRDVFIPSATVRSDGARFDEQNWCWLSKKMMDELQTLPSYSDLLARVRVPIGIIGAGSGGADSAKVYAKSVPRLLGCTVVAHADHHFSSDEYRAQLIKATLAHEGRKNPLISQRVRSHTLA